MSLKYISLFSGIEAATVAWEPLGFVPVAFSEIEKFPSDVLSYHFPHVPNLGDITKVDWKPFNDNVDIVVGGSPCFPAGTLVLTKEFGSIPIEQVRVNDHVLTHKGRWMPVEKIGFNKSDTVVLKGAGHWGLECTSGHPFFSIEKYTEWNNENKTYEKGITAPEFIKANEMVGKFWMSAAKFPEAKVPNCPYPATPEFFYFIGRYLGDGWTREYKRLKRKNSFIKQVVVCCGKRKIDQTRSALAVSGIGFHEREERTVFKFIVGDAALHDWILSNFSKYADGKKLPSWIYGIDKSLREAVLQGYRDSDGCDIKNVWRASSVSRSLAIDMKLLAASCGVTTSVIRIVNKRAKCVIEGRVVNENPYYATTFYNSSRSTFFEHGGMWGKVRKIEKGKKNVKVYNLQIAGDNSYLADGIAVHNCQSFSYSGLRAGISDSRGALMFEYIRAVAEIMPKWLIWENVPGVLSADKGLAFCDLLKALDEIGYHLSWRVLDAQWFGVPQRRRRVFLVGCLRDWKAPAAVLFEPASMCWDFRTSQEARQSLTKKPRKGTAYSVAGNIIGRSEGAGGNGRGFSEDVMYTLTSTDRHVVFDSHGQDGRVTKTDIAPTLTALMGTGGGDVPIVMGSDHYKCSVDENLSGTLRAKKPTIVLDNYLRYLTPEECEVLQGFPRGHTDIYEKTPKTPRYKAIGNSMAVPVMRWLGEGIKLVNDFVG